MGPGRNLHWEICLGGAVNALRSAAEMKAGWQDFAPWNVWLEDVSKQSLINIFPAAHVTQFAMP